VLEAVGTVPPGNENQGDSAALEALPSTTSLDLARRSSARSEELD